MTGIMERREVCYVIRRAIRGRMSGKRRERRLLG